MSICFPSSILPTCISNYLGNGVNVIKAASLKLFSNHVSKTIDENLKSREVVNLTNNKELLNKLFQDLPQMEINKARVSVEQLKSLLEKLSKYLPDEVKQTVKALPQVSQNRNLKILTTFFPNLVHIFVRAFDLFNFDRPPETLYEYGVLITLYINFFSIPTYLIYALHSLIGNPLIVGAVALGVLTAAVGGIYLYLNCSKKCPTQVSYCSNQSANFKTIGCDEKYKEVNNHFNQVCNIALIGEPGTGKTAFMNGIKDQFPNFKVMTLDSKALAGGGGAMLKVVDRIEMALRDIAGYEDQTILCYDELGDTLNSDKTMAVMLKQGIRTRFIGTMTQEQWDGLAIEIQQRFKPIFFNSNDRIITNFILTERAKEASMEIMDNAIEELIIGTNLGKTNYAQPRKAVEAFSQIQGKIEKFNLNAYIVPELKEKMDKLKELKSKILEPNSLIFTSDKDAYFKEIDQLEEEIKPLIEQSEKQKALGNKIRTYLNYFKLYREQHVALIRLFKQNGKLSKEELEQFKFAHFEAIPKIKEAIKTLENTLNPDIYVHMSEAVVQHYFAKK